MQTSDSRLDALSGIETEALPSLWKCVSEELRSRIGESTFERWFTDVSLNGVDGNAVWLETPNAIYQVWIEENFSRELRSVLEHYVLNCPPVRFVEPSSVGKVDSDETSEEPTREVSGERDQSKRSKDKKTKSRQSGQASARGRSDAKRGSAPLSDRELTRLGLSVGLSERYGFENFVVGDNNKLSHAAAKAVAEKPALSYNPLFLYSASGLGKTHLMHAIGWEVLSRRPKAKVIFISAEAFANEFIAALQNHKLVSFRKKYREADILLIDDIQFLSGKDATQEEFFHTFNTLTDARKQIVLSSDCSPGEIRALEDRLVSRFQWGLTAEIQAPILETRIAILRRKRDDWNVDVPDWVIEFVAERIRSNVRLMEGALMRAATVTSLNGRPLDEDALEELLIDFCLEEDAREVTIDAIQNTVASHYDMNVKDLTGRRRVARIALARQMAMHLSRELTGLSLKEIGEAFGGRDHGTVLHADRTIRRKSAENGSLRRTTEYLKRRLTRVRRGDDVAA